MSSKLTELDKIFISRKIILEMLDYRGYDISQYNNYINDELKLLLVNGKLDIIVNHRSQNRSLLVHYIESTGGKISPKQLKTVLLGLKTQIDDKIINDNTDTVIIISNDSITETVKEYANKYYDETLTNDDIKTTSPYKGIYIQLFEIKSLLFNIMKHELVPKHTILTDEEYDLEVKKPYKVSRGSNIPLILRSDPAAMFVGLRPKEVCRITRPSETSGIYNNYRYCK